MELCKYSEVSKSSKYAAHLARAKREANSRHQIKCSANHPKNQKVRSSRLGMVLGESNQAFFPGPCPARLPKPRRARATPKKKNDSPADRSPNSRCRAVIASPPSSPAASSPLGAPDPKPQPLPAVREVRRRCKWGCQGVSP